MSQLEEREHWAHREAPGNHNSTLSEIWLEKQTIIKCPCSNETTLSYLLYTTVEKFGVGNQIVMFFEKRSLSLTEAGFIRSTKIQ